MSALDRFPRRGVAVGGPEDGREFPVPIPESMPWPRFMCHRMHGGDWQHYVRGDGRVYEYAGPCSTVDHEGNDPHDHEPCPAPAVSEEER